MTFLEYILFIDIPVSIVLFVMIVLIIKRVKAIRRLKAVKALEGLDTTYDEVVHDTTDEKTREFPVWLLERASYAQLGNYLRTAHRDGVSFTYGHFSWNDLKRLLVKLNKLTNADFAATYVEELRTYMNYWDAV